jgi:hypothetical protein
MLDWSKDSDFVDSILFLFVTEVVKSNFLKSIYFIVLDPPNLVNLTVGSITYIIYWQITYLIYP